jgi:hypothetical protein
MGYGRTASTVLSAFLVLQIVMLLALAASPALHQALHPDCDKADHECLVTAFVKGHLGEAVMAPIVIFFAAFVMYAVRSAGLPPRLFFEYRFAPSRAPPRG